MLSPSILTIMANAIQAYEGYFAGSRSFRDNNPGNLEEVGTNGKDGVYARFATYSDGWERLIGDLHVKMERYPSKSLFEVMSIYAPCTDHNNPRKYSSFVATRIAQATGKDVTTDTTMAELQQLQNDLDLPIPPLEEV